MYMTHKKMEFRRGLIFHAVFVLILAGITLFAIVHDNIFQIEKYEFRIRGPQEDRDLRISGLSLSSMKVTLDYNGCDGDPAYVSESSLYSPGGVELWKLLEGKSRDRSISQFSHINIHEAGTEIIGDIGLVNRRSTVGRYLAIAALVLLLLVSMTMIATKLDPKSVWSRVPKGGDARGHLVAKLEGLVLMSSAVFLWTSIVLYSSVTPTLLAHLFREARNRCGVEFDDVYNGLYEMRTLAFYVRDTGMLNGVTVALYGLVVGLIISYSIFLFFVSNGKGINMHDLNSSELRTLSWYCRIWSWRVSLAWLVLSVFVSFWVANLTRTRGYELNLFYWKNGSKVSQKTGLSRTGTLLDVVQGTANLFTIPALVLVSTCCIWLVLIPMVAFACKRSLIFLGKACQDMGTLLITRALVSWLTVAPTTLSMIEKPECFDQPLEDNSQWSWIYIIDPKQSCNDTMFSVFAIVVFVPAIIMLYYTSFARVVKSDFGSLVHGLLVLGALLSSLLVVVGRYQYSADMHIGACVVAIYMLTQASAYHILFSQEEDSHLKPSELLTDRILPALEECIHRLESYNLACRDLDGLKSSPEEAEEIAHLFRTVGVAINNAEVSRIPVNPPQNLNEASKEMDQQSGN
jgi:hypothetical protein